jgi:hypothetical protein
MIPDVFDGLSCIFSFSLFNDPRLISLVSESWSVYDLASVITVNLWSQLKKTSVHLI